MNHEPLPAQGPVDVNVSPLGCPFCGAHDIAVVEGDTFRWRLAVCNCCGARGPDVRIQTAGSGTKEEWELRAHAGAMAEWNKRANGPHEGPGGFSPGPLDAVVGPLADKKG